MAEPTVIDDAELEGALVRRARGRLKTLLGNIEPEVVVELDGLTSLLRLDVHIGTDLTPEGAVDLLLTIASLRGSDALKHPLVAGLVEQVYRAVRHRVAEMAL
jgi:hypothetical protein